MSASQSEPAGALTNPSTNNHHGADIQCGNCGTTITGNFCQECGQSAHVHHSLLHLIEEMMHGLWHFDAKGWRTLPLLVAYPGELTRRFIDGQRVRFISPLGLFLFMVFFMFFVFSFSMAHTINIGDKEKAKVETAKALKERIEEVNSEVAKAQAELALAKQAGKDIDDKQEDLDSALIEQKALNVTEKLNVLGASTSASDPQSDADGITTNLTGSKAAELKKIFRHARENPELVKYKMKNNAYKFALILVPLSLPFLWIMFIGRKDVSMFDHAIFSLYSLSFMAFFAAMVSLIAQYGWESLAAILFVFVPPVHMYRQLKGTYRLTVIGTLWRTFFLVCTAGLMILIFLIFIATLSAT